MPDILRSDHAPFWKADIPGLLPTDSANFRYLYYHTAADTIDKLDFDFLEKVCKATASTAIEITTQQEACK
jgi:Zn-dependent M28 family amino/carboxypeptidase